MKTLLAILMTLLPVLANADIMPRPVKPTTTDSACRFSNKVGEHDSIAAEGCSTKLCHHVVVCGDKSEAVTCPAKGSDCDGYTADACRKASQKLVATATYARTTFPRISGAANGEVKPDQGGGR